MHIGERASDLLDGRLSPAVEQQLRSHLGQCPRCADLVAAEDQVRRLLRSTTRTSTDAPHDLMAGLLSLPGQVPTGAFSMPAGRATRQPGRRVKAGLLVAGAAITVGFAAPMAINAGPALASMVPASWLPQEQPPSAQLVVVPAGPRGGTHTVLRLKSHDGPTSQDEPDTAEPRRP